MRATSQFFGQAHHPGENADHGGEDTAEECDEKRVEYAHQRRAGVGVLRGIGDQPLV